MKGQKQLMTEQQEGYFKRGHCVRCGKRRLLRWHALCGFAMLCRACRQRVGAP